MSSENQLDEKRLVQESRNALLRHYSSKSTNQTAVLITLSIALFSFFETIRYVEAWPSLLRNLYYLAFLTTFSFLIIRSLGRLFYWGQLASLIIYVKMASEKEVEEYLSSIKSGCDMWKKSTAIPTYHMRLSVQCSKQLSKSMNRVFHLIGRLTREFLCYLLLPSLLFIFSLSIYLISKASIWFVIICAAVVVVDVLFGTWRYVRRAYRQFVLNDKKSKRN